MGGRSNKHVHAPLGGVGWSYWNAADGHRKQTMTDITEVLNEIGYIKQVTPAGRTIWSNPTFILTEAELAEEDDYADETYEDYLREEQEWAYDYELSLMMED
jgi:hypothetical protein